MHVTLKHILVVDDNPANLLLTQQMLKQQYRVSCVESGSACLHFMEEDPADLILLDVSMPQMDGYQCCEKIRQHPDFSQVPIIFLTCKDNPSAQSKGYEVGGSEYITRPCEIQDVIKRIQHHLHISQT